MPGHISLLLWSLPVVDRLSIRLEHIDYPLYFTRGEGYVHLARVFILVSPTSDAHSSPSSPTNQSVATTSSSHAIDHFFINMSVLPAEVQGALTQLLQVLQSPDNTLRSQAEEQLNNDWTPNRPEVLLMGLAEQSQVAENPPVRRV